TLDESATARCLRCHDPSRSPTIGLEAAQLDHRDADYGDGRKGNPLKTLEHLEMLEPLDPNVGIDKLTYRALPALDGYAQVDTRARGYLHANCAFCHR